MRESEDALNEYAMQNQMGLKPFLLPWENSRSQTESASEKKAQVWTLVMEREKRERSDGDVFYFFILCCMRLRAARKTASPL